MEQKQLIKDCYDYIIKTIEVQNKLLPLKILYGDGSRWNNRLDIFSTTYYEIAIYIDKPKINN